jgi:hypothetical protein
MSLRRKQFASGLTALQADGALQPGQRFKATTLVMPMAVSPDKRSVFGYYYEVIARFAFNSPHRRRAHTPSSRPTGT